MIDILKQTKNSRIEHLVSLVETGNFDQKLPVYFSVRLSAPRSKLTKVPGTEIRGFRREQHVMFLDSEAIF